MIGSVREKHHGYGKMTTKQMQQVGQVTLGSLSSHLRANEASIRLINFHGARHTGGSN